MAISSIIIGLLMLGTVGALIYGVFLMARGGGDDAKANALRQNKMMVYRIWFQAAAIIVLFVVFYLLKK